MFVHNLIGMGLVFLACMIIAISAFPRTNKPHTEREAFSDQPGHRQRDGNISP